MTLISGIQTSHRNFFRGLILSCLLCGWETQKEKETQVFAPENNNTWQRTWCSETEVSHLGTYMGGWLHEAAFARTVSCCLAVSIAVHWCWCNANVRPSINGTRLQTLTHVAFLISTEATTYSAFSIKCYLLASCFAFSPELVGRHNEGTSRGTREKRRVLSRKAKLDLVTPKLGGTWKVRGEDDPEVGSGECPGAWGSGCWPGQGGQEYPRNSMGSRASTEMQRGDQITSWISCRSEIWQFSMFGWVWTAEVLTESDSLSRAFPWHSAGTAGAGTEGISLARDTSVKMSSTPSPASCSLRLFPQEY